jgi:hypothetical protein
MRSTLCVSIACVLGACSPDQFVGTDAGSDATIVDGGDGGGGDGGGGDAGFGGDAANTCPFTNNGAGCVGTPCDGGTSPESCCVTTSGATCSNLCSGLLIGCAAKSECAGLFDGGGHCCFNGSVSKGACPEIIDSGTTLCAPSPCLSMNDIPVCKVDGDCGFPLTCHKARLLATGSYFIGLCE